MNAIRTVIVDDHTLVRQSLEMVFEAESDVEVVGLAKSSEEALELIDAQQPDLVLLDVQLENQDGVELAQEIQRRFPRVGILMLSMHRERAIVDRALSSGVDGYALKEDAIEDLVYAMRSVQRGGRYLSPTLLREREAAEALESSKQRLRGESSRTELTERQKEILLLVAEGLTNREIAAKLFISQKTVENHRSNIGQQYGLNRAVDYVRYAIREGWMKP